MVKNFILILVLVVCFIGCQTKKENTKNKVLPEILIEAESDTVKIGENYIARIFISDTSYYRLDLENKSYRIKPVIKFNNEPVSVINDTGLVQLKVSVDSLLIKDNIVIEKQGTATLMFPHPNGGDVILSKFIKYYVDPSTSAGVP